ncbi:MAG TPA: hypothetical protein VK486_01350 [Thermoleophilaceae bacterium]|nr:hypothetical protein [Thermoleophilaceae bacterium]
MTTLKRISLLLALGACLAAAGCGGDDEGGKRIPADTAASLLAQLDKVQDRLDNGSEGACKDILDGPRGPNRDAVQLLIDGLPSDVDPDVREATQQSFDNLWSLVESKCQDLTPDEPAQTETTTQPETTTTETTPTETTETTPPPTETTTAPDEAPQPNDGDGNSGGAIPPTGNGNGGGGVGPGGAKQEKQEKLK